MNKIYRIVWNEARHAFVVAHENSKAKGKPSSKRKVIASAVIMALSALASNAAYAVACPLPSASGRLITIDPGVSVTSTCTLGNGVSLSVANNGIISGTAANGKVTVAPGTTAGSITNSGIINGTPTGISILNATLSGGITNTGNISGANHGITIDPNSKVTGGISNSGTISGSVDGITADNNSTITGGINNSGTITGTNKDGITVDHTSTITGGINNIGIISGLVGITVFNASTITGGISNSNSGTIDGGILLGTSSGGISALSGGITNSGKITSPSSAGIQIYNGILSSGITNSGTISGANLGIKLNQGSTLTGGINNSGAISGASSDGINVANFSTITGGITNSGTISGGQYAINVDAGSTLDGITITGANTATFTGDVFAQNTPVTILGGSTFTGTNAFDVQSFDIASGALFNMTAMPSLNGTAGISTSQGVTNAGTLSINEAVTGHITGDYTQLSTGVFQLGASGTSSFGKLVVTGKATLPNNANIVVNVNNSNSFGSGGGRLAGVISAGTLISSSFHVTDDSVMVDFIGVKNNNQVDLAVVVSGGFLASLDAQGNNTARGAAAVLENLLALKTNNGTTGNAEMDLAIDKLISNSTSAQNVSNAVSQTLPLLTGGETAAITASLHSLNHIVQSRLEGQHGLSSGDTYYENGRAWAKPFGSISRQGDDQGISGYSALTSGVVFGADSNVYRSNRVGAALSLANTNVSGNSAIAPQSSNVATYQLTVYGSQSLGEATEVNFQAGVGEHINKGKRVIVFTGSEAQSTYQSLSGQLGVGINHALLWGEVTTFTPSIRLDYTTVYNDAHTESGAGGLNLNVDRNNVNEMLISADAKLTRKVSEHIVLTGNVGGGYDTLARKNSISSAFAGAPLANFTTPVMNPSHWQARGGLGLIRTQNDKEFMLRYDVNTRASHFIEQTLSAKFRWSF